MVGTKRNGTMGRAETQILSIWWKPKCCMIHYIGMVWVASLLLPVSLPKERKTLLLMTSDYGSVRVISYHKLREGIKNCVIVMICWVIIF